MILVCILLFSVIQATARQFFINLFISAVFICIVSYCRNFLLNIIIGDMSLVGPRPIVDAEVEKYGKCFDLYIQVRPGLTGLWQVSGRNNTTYERRVELDEYYVLNRSLKLDLQILFRTALVVLKRDGAY